MTSLTSIFIMCSTSEINSGFTKCPLIDVVTLLSHIFTCSFMPEISGMTEVLRGLCFSFYLHL